MTHHYGEYIETIISSNHSSSYSEKDSYRQTPISKHPEVEDGVAVDKKEKPVEVPAC